MVRADWRVRIAPTVEKLGMSERIDAAEEQARMLTQAVNQSRLALCLTDPGQADNPIVYANAAFMELTGYHEVEFLGRNCRFLQGPDTDAQAIARVRRAIDERRTAIVEFLNYRKDGSAFVNALQIGPIFDASGRLSFFFGSQLDVTEDRAAEARAKKLAAAELHHRLTNIMSVLEILVRLTARENLDAAAQASRIAQRVRAVGEAHLHTLVMEEKQADLRQMVERVLQAYAPHGSASYALDGPVVALGIGSISPLVLLLHELATNAIKHGALGEAAGKVTLTWSVEQGAGNPAAQVLALSWRETGGPATAAPSHASGSRIVADLFAFADGELQFEWRPEGLLARARLPFIAHA